MSSDLPSSSQSPFVSSTEGHGEVRRIDVRPRQSAKPDEHDGEQAEVLLHFSCPSCLHMLGVLRHQATHSVKCPQCASWVMPPQLINIGVAKTVLPPPRKSGTHQLRKR